MRTGPETREGITGIGEPRKMIIASWKLVEMNRETRGRSPEMSARENNNGFERVLVEMNKNARRGIHWGKEE